LRGPHACATGSSRAFDAEVRQGSDDGLFQPAQKLVQVALVVAKKKNGVGHELARPVVGYVAAALDGEDGNFARIEHIRGRGRAPEGDDVGVLDHNQGVGDRSGLARGQQILLQAQNLAVASKLQVDNASRLDRGATLLGARRWARGD
jgi:hypothetical protein